MRIAMIAEHASPLASHESHGQHQHVAALAAAVGRRGHAVTIYTRRDAAWLPARVSLADHVEVAHLDAGPPVPLRSADVVGHLSEFGRCLARDWGEHGRPDVAHAHFWTSGLALREAVHILPVPRVQTFPALGVVEHRYHYDAGEGDTSPPERVGLEARLARESTRIIAMTTENRRELVGLGAPADRIDVIPRGVDLATFNLDAIGEIATRPRIVSLSRLVERRGLDVIVRALTVLGDVEFVVAGGPERSRLDLDPEARRLQQLADDLGVADRFSLRGGVNPPGAAALLSSATIVACTPWYEPFGSTALEAMACGRPVVASAVGGLLDTVQHGVTGFHVPPRSPAAAALAIRRILADSRLAGDLSVAGRDRAETYYGWERVAQATLSAYQAAIERHERGISGRTTRPPAGTTAARLTGQARELTAASGWAGAQGDRIDRWAAYLAGHLSRGGRVLAAGDGEGATQAQRFAVDLLGRGDETRRPLSALWLSPDAPVPAALSEEHGSGEVFARQIQAHGRCGDVVVLVSTAGRSPILLAAVHRAQLLGLRVLAFTGPEPNVLADVAEAAWCVPASSPAVIAAVHLLLLRTLGAAIAERVPEPAATLAPGPRVALPQGPSGPGPS